MKTYKVVFTVNGKINDHWFYVDAKSLSLAARKAFICLHNAYDGICSWEVISVSLFK